MNADHDSSSEGFRSVIDDLTVENKKLRRKLKKYERLHCSHLQEEKLFEIRMHGLSPKKQSELELVLKRFTMSVEEESPPRNRLPTDPPLVPTNKSLLHKPSSSSTFCSGPVDSAYASISSGANAKGISSNITGMRTNQRNVESYLHDIPEPLMVQNTLDMPKESKCQLVVQRLEQIFTGSQAHATGVRQPHQQQEVSHAAFDAETNWLEACSQKLWREGAREAHILPDGADLKVENFGDLNSQPQRSRDSADESDSLSVVAEASRAASPEQRPTRPLDLDLYRPQIPSDNIEYIRHLGVAVPIEPDNDQKPTYDDDWVYLNFLTNMAQLHTLNVTPEFIREAISKVSVKFELSSDGTKVRWIGGSNGTQVGSQKNEYRNHDCITSPRISRSTSQQCSFVERPLRDGVDISSRPTSDCPMVPFEDRNSTVAVTKRRPVQATSNESEPNFHYKPLFYHAALSEDQDESDVETSSLSSMGSVDITTPLNSGSNPTRRRQMWRSYDRGPMIFYKRANFCTDLAGDIDEPNRDEVSYNKLTNRIVGCAPALSEIGSREAGISSSGVCEEHAMDVDSACFNVLPEALDLEDLKTSILDCYGGQNTPIAMEASGLYHIHPEDNFVVNVQTRLEREPCHRSQSQNTKSHSRYRLPTHAIRESLGVTSPSIGNHSTINRKVVSAVKINLSPSALPPPSFAHLPASPYDSDDDSQKSNEGCQSASDSDDSAIARHDHIDSRSHIFNEQGLFMGIGATKNPDRHASNPPSSEEDSESIDLLAYARQQNPEAVKASEAEYENGCSPQRSLEQTLGKERAESDVNSMSVDGETSDSD